MFFGRILLTLIFINGLTLNCAATKRKTFVLSFSGIHFESNAYIVISHFK